MSLVIGELKIGDKGKVIRFNKMDKTYKQKLLSMGIIRGAEFIVTRKAPFGDPVEINIKGYNLSLRKDEANAVLVEKI